MKSLPTTSRPKLRKRKVDRVIEECFWQGFLDGLSDQSWGGLEYASTSGLYDYNGVRRIAEKAGHELAQGILAAHVERLNATERVPNFFRVQYEIPGRVYADCYGEARLAVK